MSDKRLLFLMALLGMMAVMASCTPAPPPLPTSAPAATPTPPPVYDVVDTPEHLIASFANAITLGDYQRAYNYWESNPQSLADFTNERQNVAILNSVILTPVWVEGAAGSQYAAISALWLITRTDGAKMTEETCFVTRRTNPEMTDTPNTPTPWKIYSLSSAIVADADAWQLVTFTCPD